MSRGSFLSAAGSEPLLQKKCGCGARANAGAKCDECSRRDLQRKAVGAAPHRDADALVGGALAGPGQPLDPGTRDFMQERFGHDFSRVRIHADAAGAASARAVNAHAYAVGSNIVFADGRYDPRSREGRKLLAHELTHVVQQGAAGVTSLQRAAAGEEEQKVPVPAAPAAEAPAAEAADPAIDALDLNATAKAAAKDLKKKHPEISFTSGKRGVADQAHAMASNIVSSKNRKWIADTYKAAPTLQKWVDDHAEATTVDDLAKGLKETMDGLTEAELNAVSKHFTGAAFDVQPQDKDADAIKKDMQGLTGVTRFLDKESGLVRWHAQFKLALDSSPSNDPLEREADETAQRVVDGRGAMAAMSTAPAPVLQRSAGLAAGTGLAVSAEQIATFRLLAQQAAVLLESSALASAESAAITTAIAEAEAAVVLVEGAAGTMAAGTIVAEGSAAATIGLAADDVTGIGVADDVAIPFTLLAAAAAAGLVVGVGYYYRKEIMDALEKLTRAIDLIERALREHPLPDIDIGPKPQPKPKPETETETESEKKPKPETGPRPIPGPRDDTNTRRRCIGPTGLTVLDPIAVVWNKVPEDDYYPSPIELGGHEYYRDIPTVLPHGEPIGVLPEYWPYEGKLLQLLPDIRGREAWRFRRVLESYGFDWEGFRYLQAEHVQDLQWGSVEGMPLDTFENLWPLDGAANMSAGSRHNQQPVEFCETPAGPFRAIPLRQMKAEGHYGRYFIIVSVER